VRNVHKRNVKHYNPSHVVYKGLLFFTCLVTVQNNLFGCTFRSCITVLSC